MIPHLDAHPAPSPKRKITYYLELTTVSGRVMTKPFTCDATWTTEQVLDQVFYEIPSAAEIRVVAISARRQQWRFVRTHQTG